MASSDESSPPVFREERVLEHYQGVIYGAAIAPDGTMVAFAEQQGKSIILVNIASAKKLFTYKHTKPMGRPAWSSDGTRFWMASQDGSVFEVSRTRRGQWTHTLVYTYTLGVHAMIHVAAYNLLVFSCRDSRLVFVDVAAKYKVIQSTHLLDYPLRLVCNETGSLLLVDCSDRALYVFTRNGDGTYEQACRRPLYQQLLHCISPSPSGSLLFMDSLGFGEPHSGMGALWRFKSPSVRSFDAAPLLKIKSQRLHGFYGAAFSSDERLLLTCETDGIRIWYIADGTEVGSIPSKQGEFFRGMTYEATSGTLAVTLHGQGIVIFRSVTAKDRAASTIPVDVPLLDRRARRPLAARDMEAVKERIAAMDASVHAACDKERALMADMDRLKGQLANTEKELGLLRTADFVKQRDELTRLREQERALENEISSHDHVLRELEENTKMPNCLAYLHGDGFEQWMHDVGFGHVYSRLKEVDGGQLATLLVPDLEARGVSFADSCALLLRGYMTRHQLSPAPHFAPPPGLLSWDATATSTWLGTHGRAYAPISSLGWTGACLCSLSAERVRGLLGAASFAKLHRIVHDQLVLDGAPEWAQSWSGLAVMDR